MYFVFANYLVKMRSDPLLGLEYGNTLIPPCPVLLTHRSRCRSFFKWLPRFQRPKILNYERLLYRRFVRSLNNLNQRRQQVLTVFKDGADPGFSIVRNF